MYLYLLFISLCQTHRLATESMSDRSLSLSNSLVLADIIFRYLLLNNKRVLSVLVSSQIFTESIFQYVLNLCEI